MKKTVYYFRSLTYDASPQSQMFMKKVNVRDEDMKKLWKFVVHGCQKYGHPALASMFDANKEIKDTINFLRKSWATYCHKLCLEFPSNKGPENRSLLKTVPNWDLVVKKNQAPPVVKAALRMSVEFVLIQYGKAIEAEIQKEKEKQRQVEKNLEKEGLIYHASKDLLTILDSHDFLSISYFNTGEMKAGIVGGSISIKEAVSKLLLHILYEDADKVFMSASIQADYLYHYDNVKQEHLLVKKDKRLPDFPNIILPRG